MDPVSLAVAAVELLIPFFRRVHDKVLDRFATDISDAVAAKAEVLYGRLRTALSGDPYDIALLEGARAEPDDQARLANLQAALVKRATEDDAFAAQLSELVAEAERSGAVRIQVRDAGAFAGRDFNQVGVTNIGRDQINHPSSPEPPRSARGRR